MFSYMERYMERSCSLTEEHMYVNIREGAGWQKYESRNLLNRLVISIFLDSKCSSSHSIKTWEFPLTNGISIQVFPEFLRKRTCNFCLHGRSASRVTFTMANKIILLPGLEPCCCLSLVCSLIAFAQARIFQHFADSLFLSLIDLGPLSIAASYPALA